MKHIFILMFCLFLSITPLFTQSSKLIQTISDTSLKEEPKLQAKELLIITANTKLEVIEKVNNFYKVKYKNIIGYIYWDKCFTLSSTKSTSTFKESSSSSKLKKSSSSDKKFSYQCKAITKKGRQCSRKAQTGSNYCWQHQR